MKIALEKILFANITITKNMEKYNIKKNLIIKTFAKSLIYFKTIVNIIIVKELDNS